jgi:ribokinase
MGRVLVLGSINSDLVVRIARLPRPGETVVGGEFAVYGGGKGANQAIAAARAGAAVAMIGCVGEDAYGAARLADLQREGIETSGVRRLAGVASGVALIGVDATGQNLIMVASGANHQATVAMGAALPCAAGDVALLQLELPLPVVAAGLAAARRAGALAILNAAPVDPAAAALLPDVDLLVVNEIEAADLLGAAADAVDAAVLRRLAALGPRQVVVTLGGAGVAVWDGAAAWRLPALPVTPVDTTGAGDAFCGVLAAGLAAGLDLAGAVRRGVVAGGLAVTRPGAQSSLPARAEIEAALGRLESAT